MTILFHAEYLLLTHKDSHNLKRKDTEMSPYKYTNFQLRQKHMKLNILKEMFLKGDISEISCISSDIICACKVCRERIPFAVL